jgi:hypothetical protein
LAQNIAPGIAHRQRHQTLAARNALARNAAAQRGASRGAAKHRRQLSTPKNRNAHLIKRWRSLACCSAGVTTAAAAISESGGSA